MPDFFCEYNYNIKKPLEPWQKKQQAREKRARELEKYFKKILREREKKEKKS